jgi:hypothetical protein
LKSEEGKLTLIKHEDIIQGFLDNLTLFKEPDLIFNHLYRTKMLLYSTRGEKLDIVIAKFKLNFIDLHLN